MIVLFLIFWGRSIMFSIVVVLMYIPTNIAEDLLFFIYWGMIIYFLLDDGHSDRGKVISHCGFDMQFPDSDFEHLFMYLLAIYIASSVCVCFFCLFVLLLLNWNLSYVYILAISPLSDTKFANIFFLFILLMVSSAMQKFILMSIAFSFGVRFKK